MSLQKEKMFQYAVIWHPTDEQFKDGKRSKMIVDLNVMLAPTSEAVGMKAIKSIPSEFDNELDQVEVVVRPF